MKELPKNNLLHEVSCEDTCSVKLESLLFLFSERLLVLFSHPTHIRFTASPSDYGT